MNELDKIKLLNRANYQCEYCHKVLKDEFYEIDHIIPGLENISNYAIACSRCNRNKSNFREWIDPFSGQTEALFHPRFQNWHEHFRKDLFETVGISSTGSATANLLFKDTSQFLPQDLEWNIIDGLSDNHAIYYFLNHLRYRRLRNDFTTLYKQITNPPQIRNLNKNETVIVNFTLDMLLLELFFTRSKISDIDKGLLTSDRILKKYNNDPAKLAEIYSALSILHQQKATVLFNQGNYKQAKLEQKKSFDLHIKKINNQVKNKNLNNVKNMKDSLRASSLKAKYYQIDVSSSFLDDCIKVIIDSDHFYDLAQYTYLVDIVLLSPKPNFRIIENLFIIVSSLLTNYGYGSNLDKAKMITLRRRWWALKLIVDRNNWQELLINDLKLWNRISMYNEIRELKSYLHRVDIKLNLKISNELLKIFG